MLGLYAVISAIFTAVTALLSLDAGFKLFWIIPVSFVSTLIGFILLHAAIFLIAIQFVNTDKSPDSYSGISRLSVKFLLKILVPLIMVKVHTTGTDKVPTNRRFLLVSNHLHDVDPAVIMYSLPNSELGFIGKKEIYRDMKFISKVMHSLHGLPIDRENPRNAVLTINSAAEKIKSGTVSMSIFPEGYTSFSGELQPFRNGAFKIAKKANCPIVVATLKNTKQVVKNLFRRRTDVYFDVLEVIDEKQVENLSTAELSDHIHTLMSDNLK